MKTKTGTTASPLLPLTEKEKNVLEMIESTIAERGVSPSYQEIRDHFGFASINSVQNYLRQLVTKGYIQIPLHQKRAIQILHSADAIRERVRLQRPQNSHRSSELVQLPLLGQVAAGLPLEAVYATNASDSREFIDIPSSMVRNPDKTFALKVSGQSMVEDGIHDGDVIVVQGQASANNGEIVVATVEEESTVKRFYLRTDSERSEKVVELKPSNSSMKSMWFSPSQVQIKGIVVALIRKF